MSAFDLVRDMRDVALQPRLLRSLINERLPDGKRPFGNASELSHVVSLLKTHRLLSESFPDDADPKFVEKWKQIVDSWVDRLCELASSNMPDKCWAGISLLGVTCQECSSERFLNSYSVWFSKLLSHVQQPTDSHFVKASSCTSLLDLLTRLAGFPNAKKDAVAHVGKLIQPILKLLNEDSSEDVWAEAVRLLCTAVTLFPSSVQRHHDNAEAALISKIMSDKCSDNMLKSLARSLALLPKARGDEESWLLLMQRILFTINLQLNDAFQGLEEEARSHEVVRLLFPPGKEHPPPLGSKLTPGEAMKHTGKGSERFVMSRVSTLMLCCSAMLGNSYPVQVTVPIRPILAVVGRVLAVDGSLPHGSFPYLTAMHQEFICSQLPVLHSYSLDLLSEIVKGLRSQLLPHSAEIVQLLTQYFQGCVIAELRVKVYSVIKILLLSMGVGISLYISEEVINNAFADLHFISHETVGTSMNLHSNKSVEASMEPIRRKRKHNFTTGSLEQQDKAGFDGKAGNKYASTPVSVMIAALEALETLLVVGGAYKSQSWRSNVDHLLMSVATNACTGGWVSEEENVYMLSVHIPTWADLQLASLRALLSSLLSPTLTRPPYLALGLDLFQRGRLESGTRLAQFCAHALLALEVLIHPRAYSVADFSSMNDDFSNGENYRYSQFGPSGYQKHNIPHSSGSLRSLGMGGQSAGEDDLYRSWLENEVQVEIQVTGERPNDVNAGEPAAESIEPRSENVNDEPMAETQQPQEPTSSKASLVSGNNGGDAEMQPVEGISSEVGRSDAPLDQEDSWKRRTPDGSHEAGKGTSVPKADSGKGKAIDLDSDDSFPEIIIDDSDSD